MGMTIRTQKIAGGLQQGTGCPKMEKMGDSRTSRKVFTHFVYYPIIRVCPRDDGTIRETTGEGADENN